MLIAIVGTPSAGKKTVLDYLVNKHGFREIKLSEPKPASSSSTLDTPQVFPTREVPIPDVGELYISREPTPALTPSTPSPVSTPNLPAAPLNPPAFPDSASMLDYITRTWLAHHVTMDLKTYEDILPFVKRPFFMLVFVDGPLRVRYERERRRLREASGQSLTLDQFIDAHDLLMNGPVLPPSTPMEVMAKHPQSDFRRVQALATINVCNDFPTVAGLHAYLTELDLLDEERLRPGWDQYFMTLASLASHRSNCMKRRVGALLVRSKRILSTGYNGTARGTRNCNQGGCSRCNGSARGGEALNECLCLHAEENALLEAGKDRIGEDSIIYCNTCPCLRCSVKIVQCGVREVVYNQSYSMDEASARVLQEAGVILRQLVLPGDRGALL